MSENGAKIDQGSLKSYLIGALLSLLLTFGAYAAATAPFAQGLMLHVLLAGLGLIQAWVFLFFFLHLGKELKPRWNIGVFLFMVMVTVILVIGSIWIMYHLNYNLMSME